MFPGTVARSWRILKTTKMKVNREYSTLVDVLPMFSFIHRYQRVQCFSLQRKGYLPEQRRLLCLFMQSWIYWRRETKLQR